MLWINHVFSKYQSFIFSSLLQLLTCVSFFRFDVGNSIWYKSCFCFLGSLIVSVVSNGIWKYIPYYSYKNDKDNLLPINFKSFALSNKSSGFFHVLKASLFLTIHVVSFLKSKSTNLYSNSVVFCFIRVFGMVSTGIFRSSATISRIFSSFIIFFSIHMYCYSSSFQMIYLYSSIAFWSLFVVSFKNVILSFSSTNISLVLVLFTSSIITLVFSVIFEGFSTSVSFIQCLLFGIFLFFPPNMFIKRRNLEKNQIYSYSYVPLFITMLFGILKSQLASYPFFIIFLSILIQFSLKLLSFPFHQIKLFSFTSIKTSFSFMFSIMLSVTSVYQCFLYHRTKNVWMYSDSVYLLICLSWSMRESWKCIQKVSSEKFSFGLGRISDIFSFSVFVSASFFVLFNVYHIFFDNNNIITPGLLHSFPSILCHIILNFFFLSESKGKSVVNAVNFHSTETKKDTKNVISIVDIVALILTVIGSFNGSIILDRIISIFILTLSVIKIIPEIITSFTHLITGIRPSIVESLTTLTNKIKGIDIVDHIPRFNAFNIDDTLCVGTTEIALKEQSISKSQQVLLYIIAEFQRLGVLDITVEVL